MKSPLPRIKLYDLYGLGLILSFPSGVSYTNQAAGSVCLQPAHEGVLVPLTDQLVDQEALLRNYFVTNFNIRRHGNSLNDEAADFIDNVLSMSRITSHIKTDRSKLDQSFEAWVNDKVENC